MSDPKADYISDLTHLLIENARKALATVKADSNATDFDQGVLHGYYAVLSLMEQQADAFGISRSDLGLKYFASDELLK